MSGKPYRLAQGGRLIDRGRKISFSFDGRTMQGYDGDTLASAVLANGQRLMGRSFKYHRPRGVVGIERAKRIGECLGGVAIDGVLGRRTIEDDRHHRAGSFDSDHRPTVASDP